MSAPDSSGGDDAAVRIRPAEQRGTPGSPAPEPLDEARC
ncbi:hypothetical protein SAMN05443637_12046 [Pseudonocardia thermophila]|jgi:hypothetical protein|uniref:Uncharacterized protein n=1 Tax=Pseudonocardia thermophila TaxID=1848 RepID=A0A1M6YIW5_PSETH|nr:hypothetical protein SAMN05443637_12046 [Pseudonocardia thermophila]